MHVVVANESYVTECMIHTGGEQVQGNDTPTLPGAKNRRKKGGLGKLDSTSFLRLDKDPR